MNVEELRDYCISVKGATESFPFGKDILVFKVMEKMFVYIDLLPKDGQLKASMKCDPQWSAELRLQYEGVERGAHTQALSWNAVLLDSDVPDQLIRELIDHSVSEVVKKLPKKKQEEYSKI